MQKMTSFSEDVEKLEPLEREYKNETSTMERMVVSQEVKNSIAIQPTSTASVYMPQISESGTLKRYCDHHVQSNTIRTNLKEEKKNICIYI